MPQTDEISLSFCKITEKVIDQLKNNGITYKMIHLY